MAVYACQRKSPFDRQVTAAFRDGDSPGGGCATPDWNCDHTRSRAFTAVRRHEWHCPAPHVPALFAIAGARAATNAQLSREEEETS